MDNISILDIFFIVTTLFGLGLGIYALDTEKRNKLYITFGKLGIFLFVFLIGSIQGYFISSFFFSDITHFSVSMFVISVITLILIIYNFYVFRINKKLNSSLDMLSQHTYLSGQLNDRIHENDKFMSETMKEVIEIVDKEFIKLQLEIENLKAKK